MEITSSGPIHADGVWNVEVELRYGRRFASTPRTVFFRSTAGPLSSQADFLVPIGLLPAMNRHEDLKINGAISPRMYAHLTQLQHVLKVFGPTFGHRPKEVSVEADAHVAASRDESRGVAAFFSGGVDSLYTALNRREELDALIYVHGFDVALEDQNARSFAMAGVRAAAREIGLPLLEVETNLRSFSDRSVHWEFNAGAALATIGLLLEPLFRKIYIASTYALPRLMATGSHPLIDPLFSTETVEIVHHAEVERGHKLEVLAESEVAHRYLRVCYEATASYNCGVCRKCLMTMVNLKALEALDRFQVFPHEFDLEEVRNLNVSSEGLRIGVHDTIEILSKRQAQPELLDALMDSLRRYWENRGATESHSRYGAWFADAWNRAAER